MTTCKTIVIRINDTNDKNLNINEILINNEDILYSMLKLIEESNIKTKNKKNLLFLMSIIEGVNNHILITVNIIQRIQLTIIK